MLLATGCTGAQATALPKPTLSSSMNSRGALWQRGRPHALASLRDAHSLPRGTGPEPLRSFGTKPLPWLARSALAS
jgi:hypothetical protein